MKRILSAVFVVALAFTMITGCACKEQPVAAVSDKCADQCLDALRKAEAAAQRAEAAARRAEAAADKAESMIMKTMKKGK